MAVTRFHGDRQIEDGTIDKDDLNSTLQTEIDAKVVGPASSTDNAIARFDSTTGKLVQNSSATISDTGRLDVSGSINTNDNISTTGGVISTNVSVQTDSLIEFTAAAGVTVDGVLIKDTTVDVNGTADALILDADGDTTISAPTDDQIDFEVGGTDRATLNGGGLTVIGASPGTGGITTGSDGLFTNVISERTAAAGVTVDGVLIKDGAIAKSVVGLGNVDNTSDANKPVSTAQRTAIDALPISQWTHFEEVAGSFDITPTSSQGIAWDGTYFYITNNTHIYKYNSTGTLQTSRDVSADGTVGKLGGLTVVSGVLYVSASNYPTTPEVGYIMEFDASDLSYNGENSVGAIWPGSIAYKDSAFWLCTYDGTVEQWPTNFSSRTAEYIIDAGTTELDGIEWVGESLFITGHDDSALPAVRQYSYNGTTFTPIRNIERPDGYCGQDLFWDSTNERMYFNRRGYTVISDAVLFTELRAEQEKYHDKSGWIPFATTLSRSSWDATTRTAVINCTDADEFLSPGNRIRFAQPTNGVDKFGIVTAVSSTTFTIFMNSDYDVDAENIYNGAYSYMKSPHGFVLDANKYSLTFSESTDRSTAATANTWYKLNAAHQLEIPVGVWDVKAKATVYAQYPSSTQIKVHAALSTSTSSVSNDELYAVDYYYDATGNVKRKVMPAHLTATLTVSSSTVYNLIVRQDANGTLDIRANGDPNTIIKATCAYL